MRSSSMEPSDVGGRMSAICKKQNRYEQYKRIVKFSIGKDILSLEMVISVKMHNRENCAVIIEGNAQVFERLNDVRYEIREYFLRIIRSERFHPG